MDQDLDSKQPRNKPPDWRLFVAAILILIPIWFGPWYTRLACGIILILVILRLSKTKT